MPHLSPHLHVPYPHRRLTNVLFLVLLMKSGMTLTQVLLHQHGLQRHQESQSVIIS
ncbi:hypothetical protein BT69DRAFT_1283032 [Atractiella rhizophila]|nr:hypothetical protein BT69DRAFT_1283032 [Atractiella rhizophila]